MAHNLLLGVVADARHEDDECVWERAQQRDDKAADDAWVQHLEQQVAAVRNRLCRCSVTVLCCAVLCERGLGSMARQWVQTKGKDDAEDCDEKEVSCDRHAARHLVVDAREVVHDLRHGRRHVSSHTQTSTHRLTHSSLRFVFL